jgi:hypothetical protein
LVGAGAAGHEGGSGHQIVEGLGLPARQGCQELLIRDRHRGSRGLRLGPGLSERDKGKKAEEDENGLSHTFISQVDGTGRKPAASKGKGALAHPGRAGTEVQARLWRGGQ